MALLVILIRRSSAATFCASAPRRFTWSLPHTHLIPQLLIAQPIMVTNLDSLFSATPPSEREQTPKLPSKACSCSLPSLHSTTTSHVTATPVGDTSWYAGRMRTTAVLPTTCSTTSPACWLLSYSQQMRSAPSAKSP